MFIVILIAVILFWTVIGFFDIVFKSCMLPPYLALLEKSNIVIRPFQIQWYTSRWNRLFQKLGSSKALRLRKWFGFGSVVTSILAIPSIFLLCHAAKNMVSALNYETVSDQILQPVLPGVNLPLTHIVYYFVSLTVCSIFHELGHALAAVRENVKIEGCGLFIFGIFPGAYVDLPTENMLLLTSWQQLKIYCAGVWHNIVLATFALCLLYVNPFLLYPFYHHGNGISVLSVTENSGAAGPGGLSTGDIITAVLSCSVKTEEHWKECLLANIQNPARGYCIPLTFITQEDMTVENNIKSNKNSVLNCCDAETQHGLCFHYWLLDNEKYSCLPVRKLLQQSGDMCKTSEDCEDSSWTCTTPHVDNDTKLLQLYRRGKKSMIFIGNPMELYLSVYVSNWIPKYSIFSNVPIQIYETFLKYILSFSGALAIMNIIPCFILDGFWITTSLGELILPIFISNLHRRQFFLKLVLSFGMLLIIANVSLGLLTLFMMK